MVYVAGMSSKYRRNDVRREDELEAAVVAYVEMQRGERDGQLLVTKLYSRKLAEHFGRSEKAVENQMQHISYVLALQGRNWLTGFKPADDLDKEDAVRIEKLLAKVEGHRSPPVVAFEIAVREGIRQKDLAKPDGDINPARKRIAVTRFSQNAIVKAWVLQQAAGRCEGCERPAPFSGVDGLPYLELHYMRQLMEGGADTVSNAVALCPNCHREIHHGANAQALVAWLYDNLPRLARE